MYRFVHVAEVSDPTLADDFRSDRENGAVALFRREQRYPELLDGMSVYDSLEAATTRWNQCRATALQRGEKMQMGAYIAEVELIPKSGFSIEDLHKVDGHLTIWGPPDRLAAATRRIYVPEVKDG